MEQCLLVFVNPFHARHVREKMMEEQNPRWTTSSSPFTTGFLLDGKPFLFFAALPTCEGTLVCLCRPFSCQACLEKETDEISKPACDLRSISGSSAILLRFIGGTRSAVFSWLLTIVPTPICLCTLFSCKACLRILFFQVACMGFICFVPVG